MTASSSSAVLYRFAWVKQLRMLLRMKILQLGGGLGVVVPATQLLGVSGVHSTFELGLLAGLSCGTVAVATTCSWYCERLVQELRLDGTRLRVSTLTMWGHRKDADFTLSAIEPTYAPEGPEESEARKAMVPLHLGGTTFMLLRHPLNFIEPLAMHRLLCGLPLPPHLLDPAAVVAAATTAATVQRQDKSPPPSSS